MLYNICRNSFLCDSPFKQEDQAIPFWGVKSLDIVLPTIQAFVSDHNMQRIAKGGRKNVFRTKEEEEKNKENIVPCGPKKKSLD